MIYLIGFGYHEPEDYAAWERGVIEDFESSTGIFISAPTKEEALRWGEVIAGELFRRLNPKEPKSWKESGHAVWIEENPATGSWKHCLGFFQHVRVGQMPDFAEMGTPAYVRWMKAHS
jgi:hypothetical protein